MRQLLHIVTKPNDALAGMMLENEQSLPNTKVDMVDLTNAKPDYKQLVEKIFAADSIQVW
jgi:hypothetical protein